MPKPSKDEASQLSPKPDLRDNELPYKPDTLILSDSILKEVAPLLTAKYQNIDIKVLSGAKVQDCIKYLTNKDWVPDKVVFFYVCSNNIRGARTINHIV